MPSTQPVKPSATTALHPYNIKPKTFLLNHEQYDDITVASFVFHPPKFDLIRRPPFNCITDKGIASNAPYNCPIEPARLLLLQRTCTDITSPDLWEVPWGNSEFADPTILHSVQRVMLETTGLHLTRLLKLIGSGEESVSSQRVTLHLSFETEIDEMVDLSIGIFSLPSHEISVEIDTKEHQDSIWATEKEIKDDEFELAVPQQKDIILQAFRRRRRTEEKVRARAVRASRARKRAYYGARKRDKEVKVEEEEEEEVEEEVKEEEVKEEKVKEEEESKRRR